MIHLDSAPALADLQAPAPARLSRWRRTRSKPSTANTTSRRARPSSRSAGDTPPAAGRSGRKASATASPSCTSTPPATSSSLASGRERTVRKMASHVSHIGVHDHGFNNLSTYGNLRRLMLRRPVARRRVGAELLRTGDQGLRRGPGRPLDRAAGRRLHPLLQRPALAVRRHHPLLPHPDGGPPPRPRADERGRQGRFPCSTAPCSTSSPRRSFPSSTARAVTPTTSAAAPPTSACSTPRTAPTAARTRSRATPASAPGPAARPGRRSASRRSWSCWTRWTRPSSSPTAARRNGKR
jgi:hypothetical protein